MENEVNLIEQIESYIDQLDLLGMQEKIDQSRIDKVNEHLKKLAVEYEVTLERKLESQIQEVEKVYAKTLEEEREKRKNILLVVKDKFDTFNNLFSKVFQIKEATYLQEHIDIIMKKLESQVKEYEDDLQLVDSQLAEIKNAEKTEERLKDEKNQAHKKVTSLRNSQISYEQLNDEIMALYLSILQEGNIGQINFSNVRDKEKALRKRQERFLENLELARSAKDAEEYITMYEERVRNGNLELDKLVEQNFLHLLSKMVQAPVDSYESLEKRTGTIQSLVASRIAQVEKLYNEGIIKKEEYGTLASKINHKDIYTQLNNLTEMNKSESLITSIDEKLKYTREHIKNKDELESIFAERAKKRGREAIIPKALEKPEILFEDEEIKAEKMPEKKKRRQVISVAPIKKSLLDKISKVKTGIMESKKNLHESYKPTIGDKIKFGDTTEVFINPMEVVEVKNGKEAKNIGLTEIELYVTRGAILDSTGIPLYITADYGVDLEEIAKNMNLVLGSYSIALGCATGDLDGNFIAVTNDKLNPDIEKGWINAADSSLVIINQLNSTLNKGGMNK